MDLLVEARGIVNRFGAQVVHDGLDLGVRRGEVFGIVGGSGTGKSVLLRTILGLRRPDAGSVRIAGQDIATLRGDALRRAKAQKYPAELSGGMVKRAALARALALDPPLLFLDEPTSGLDPISAAAFDELIAYLQRELSLTVVMITHDLDSIFRVCNRVGVIVDRGMVTDELPRIVDHPHPWIRSYFHGERARRFTPPGA
jgi:phospholipid/cholesterol/gamma-HCH transport system ATP-binding protein